MEILKSTLVRLVLFLLSTSFANSQSSRIEGFVTDKDSHETIMGATVVLEGTNYKTITDMDGYFSFNNVKPGVYKLSVAMISYKTLTIDHVKAEAGNNLLLKEALNEINRSAPAELEPILSKPDLSADVSLSSL